MTEKLGPHYVDALWQVRGWEVYRLNLDQYAGDPEVTEQFEIKECYAKHMNGVRAVRAIDILAGRLEEPGFYEQLRRSAVWAASQLPEDYVEQTIARETNLDTAKVIGTFTNS